MMPPDEILKKIREYVCENYDIDDGYSAHDQEKEVRIEIEAYNNYVRIFDGVPDDVASKIKGYCSHDDSSSWCDTFDFCESEIESYKSLVNYRDEEIDEITVRRLIDVAKAEVSSGLSGGEYFEIWSSFQRHLSEIKIIRKISREAESSRELLIEMEAIIASECYNGNIQNYSSWGVWVGEGRFFRYPVTFSSPFLDKRESHVPSHLPTDSLVLGKYKFGANHLYIYKALINIVRHIEKKYEISLADLDKK